jgi:hypothetical protein
VCPVIVAVAAAVAVVFTAPRCKFDVFNQLFCRVANVRKDDGLGDKP